MRIRGALLVFLTLASAGAWAQGLNTPPGVTKDDWEEINFEFNSSVLVDGFPSLLRLGELLQKNPGYKVQVEGHTDIIGNKPYNDKLGLARANAVRDFLVKYGAAASQISVTSNGKDDPRYPGQKSTFQKTDEARWMNRRVSLTVTDAEGKTVSAGGPGEAIRAIQAPASNPDCCSEVLKRLDKLDDISKMLKDLGDQNSDLRKQIADLKAAQDAMKQGQQVLESKVNQPPPPAPPSATEVANEVTKNLEKNKRPNFQLLSANIGADNTGNTTATAKGRYFTPFAEHFGFEAQAEYMYFKTDKEGQFDVGLVDRVIPNLQAGLFASFKHAQLAGEQTGGTMGEAALTVDYLFSRGKLGFFGTKGFLNSGIINSVNATDPVTGAIVNHLFLDTYLHTISQAGLSTTLGLYRNMYLEGNGGWLHSDQYGNRFGGTLRFVFPVNNKLAFTVEGGMNETLLTAQNTGRAMVGLQLSNMIRPKDFMSTREAVAVDPPRIRYEMITKRVRTGDDPPVANAGPNQINVPAGVITLNGSNSYSPDGNPITYQWIEEVGPTVTLSNPTAAVTSFTAVQGQTYSFLLVVTDNFGLKGQAQVTVTTQKAVPVSIGFFIANPSTITAGQSSTLQWNVGGGPTSVTITPGIGGVAASGSTVVSPTQTTTYTLTATNAQGTQTQTVVVVVTPVSTKFTYCYASPTNIISGESSTINWSTTNTTSVSINNGVGTVANNGSVAVSPTTTTTYVLTATGQGSPAGQSTDTCSVTVTVSAGQLPRIIRFSAVPATILTGQNSTLLWVVENATSVSINNGVGASVSLGATQIVSPTSTTTYTITATNVAGSVTATATVNVIPIPPPVITSFTATPNPSAGPGSLVNLSCLTNGAQYVTVAGVESSPKITSWQVFPQTTTTYTCSVLGINGTTVQQSLTVTVP